MRIDVVDVLEGEAGIGEASLHGRHRALDGRGDDVGGIAGHADAGKLGENGRAARNGMVVGLEHDDAGAFAEHQARRGRPRTAGRCRGRPRAAPPSP